MKGFLLLGTAALGFAAPGQAQRPDPARDGAMAEYERTGEAPVVRAGGMVLYPFGHGTPQLSCAPLRACRIELQSGEVVLSPPGLGDTERWLTEQIVTGPGGATPVVVIKPTDCGLATNLLISTDRRIYDIDLDAGACGRGPNRQIDYTRSVRFYYPNEAAPAPLATAPAAPSMTEMAARARNTNYRWKRRNGFPWEPVRVADDGIRTYIQLPPEAQHEVAPVLYLLEGDGGYSVLNYAPRGDWYVADRVFHRAALVIGTGEGKRERRLEIERFAARRRSPLRTVLPALGGAVLVGAVAALAAGG